MERRPPPQGAEKDKRRPPAPPSMGTEAPGAKAAALLCSDTFSRTRLDTSPARSGAEPAIRCCVPPFTEKDINEAGPTKGVPPARTGAAAAGWRCSPPFTGPTAFDGRSPSETPAARNRSSLNNPTTQQSTIPDQFHNRDRVLTQQLHMNRQIFIVMHPHRLLTTNTQ
uniref:Uncharacterized protein n=1 Tax=Oryzias melastigma TaxID=30732 RepID=A0A3B3DAY1_ORYME